MAGAEAGPVVTVEIFVEQDEVSPVRVLLELACAAVNRTSSILIFEENAGQPLLQLLSHLIKRQAMSRSCRKLDRELITIVHIVLKEATDYQGVHWHPDRSAPVGVATEHSVV